MQQDLIAKQNQILSTQSDLLNLSNEDIFAWELDGGIIYWNKGAERMYGYNSGEGINRISHDLLKTIHPFDINNIKFILRRDGVWKGEGEVKYETICKISYY
jgi:PAS domain-containing protein